MYQEKCLERLDQLISQGQRVIATERQPGPNVIAESWVDDTEMAQWRTSSLNFLKTVFGETSAHYTEFEKNCKRSKISDAEKGYGILRAAKDDIENGFLKNIESMVSADIFSDFIQMGEHLMKENYYHAAASLVGAVLEDSLRKLCEAKKIEVKNSDRLFNLNAKLHEQNVYNKIMWKSIDAWRETRNCADHGKFNEVSPENVKSMVDGVRDFLTKYLA